MVTSEGLGSVYSWVVVHRTLNPGFEGQTPYAVVAVDLDGGGRMMGRFLGPIEDIDAGLRVCFSSYEDKGLNLPGFVSADG